MRVAAAGARGSSRCAWQQQVGVKAAGARIHVPACGAAPRCLRNDTLRHRRVVYNVQCGSAGAIVAYRTVTTRCGQSMTDCVDVLTRSQSLLVLILRAVDCLK